MPIKGGTLSPESRKKLSDSLKALGRKGPLPKWHCRLVSEGLKEYWSRPGVKEARFGTKALKIKSEPKPFTEERKEQCRQVMLAWLAAHPKRPSKKGWKKRKSFERNCRICKEPFFTADVKGCYCDRCKNPRPCDCGCGKDVSGIGKTHAKGCKNNPIEQVGHKAQGRAISGDKNPAKRLETQIAISNALMGHPVSEKNRRAISDRNAMLIMTSPEKLPRSWGKSGWFKSEKNDKNHFYRSKLELWWYKRFEFDPKVISFATESHRIYYWFNGKRRSYIPDLLIEYSDGTFVLVEIKPKHEWKDPQNLAKWKFGRLWCKAREGVTKFKVLGEYGKKKSR